MRVKVMINVPQQNLPITATTGNYRFTLMPVQGICSDIRVPLKSKPPKLMPL